MAQNPRPLGDLMDAGGGEARYIDDRAERLTRLEPGAALREMVNTMRRFRRTEHMDEGRDGR